MRAVVGIAGAAALGLGAVLLRPDPAAAVCSVFDKHPCAPTVCSVFRRGPCRPEFDPPLGQTLQLTITVAAAAAQQPASDDHDDAKEKPKLNTLQDLFAALRACPVALPEVGRLGMQMTVQLSFKRNGEIIGTPRITFTTRSASPEVKEAYYQAITTGLQRCAPLSFTDGLGGAIAGRPIAIRYIDNRMLESEHI